MIRSATPFLNIAATTVPVALARAVAALARALVHRREIMHLAEFDDRMLKDIGLVRGDVEGALAGSLLHNPSQVLVRCAARHRRSERSDPAAPQRPVVPFVRRAAGRA